MSQQPGKEHWSVHGPVNVPDIVRREASEQIHQVSFPYWRVGAPSPKCQELVKPEVVCLRKVM